jgi:hypothetical protein
VTFITVIATCCPLPFKVVKRPIHNAVSHKRWDGFNTLQNTLFKVRDADKLCQTFWPSGSLTGKIPLLKD